MRNRKTYGPLLLAALFVMLIAPSCTEKINVDLGTTYTRLVVDGVVSTDTMSYQVNLTKTSDYFYNEPAPRVIGAAVNLSDGSSVFHLTETSPGVYSTDSNFAARIGSAYAISVDLAEPIDNQQHYEGSCTVMTVPRLDSIQVVFEPDYGTEGFWLINVFAQEPGDQVNYYMFKYYRNDTLMTDTITKISVSDDRYFNGSYINGLTAIYINNEDFWETLHPGDKVTVQMSGITREYYDFISQVQIAGINIPFFTGPPANVMSNINNGAVGFFAAYSNSWATTTVK
jgi:hypothetical protein